jgi:hypothetical protein
MLINIYNLQFYFEYPNTLLFDAPRLGMCQSTLIAAEDVSSAGHEQPLNV